MTTKKRVKSLEAETKPLEDKPIYDCLGNRLWEVEKIIDSKKEDGQELFFVKWLGWKDKYNTWEPEQNLRFIPDMVKAFKRRLKESTPKQQHKKKKVKFSTEFRAKKELINSHYEDEDQNDENFCPNLASSSKKIKKAASSAKTAAQKSILRNRIAEVDISYAHVPKRIYGMFQTDIPCEIEEHAIYAIDAPAPVVGAQNHKISNLMLKVRWLRRGDGLQPESTWYLSAEVKTKCPHILLSYYEKYIKFTSS